MEQGAEGNHNPRQAQGADDPGLVIPEHQPPGRQQKGRRQQVEAVAEQALGAFPEQIQHGRPDAHHGKEQEQGQKGQNQRRKNPPQQGGFWLGGEHLRGFFIWFCPGPLGGGFGLGGSFRHEGDLQKERIENRE